MYTHFFRRLSALLAISSLLVSAALAQEPAAAVPLMKPSISYKIKNTDDRLEMIIHSSRILSTEHKIVQIEPGNRDILDMTTLSPNQIQITAKALGMTEINVWDENKTLYTVGVLVVADSRELALALRMAFPDCALKVTPVKDAVMISGSVDKNEYVDQITRIAEEYYPAKGKIINRMTVSGCQKILLQVKIMEVSRTKLRQLGFDWAKITGTNMVASGPSQMVAMPSSPTLTSGVGSTAPAAATTPGNPIAGTFAFNIASGASAFFGVLDALREDDLAKILAEPTLTTISGRPAHFRAGGSFYIVPNGQNGGPPLTVNYGTQLDFVPIALGNGRIHLDVRSTISEPDPSQPAQYQPALKDRSAETGTELLAGQTFAIAGLVQSRIEASNVGLPWASELPYLGVAFRRVKEVQNEIELLILVTPELVEPLDACEVPPCGPGMETTSPSDVGLYLKGHLEVPRGAPRHGCATRGGAPCGPSADGATDSNEPVPAPQPTDGDARRKPHNRYAPSRQDSAKTPSPPAAPDSPPGFIGPVGYDVVK